MNIAFYPYWAAKTALSLINVIYIMVITTFIYGLTGSVLSLCNVSTYSDHCTHNSQSHFAITCEPFPILQTIDQHFHSQNINHDLYSHFVESLDFTTAASIARSDCTILLGRMGNSVTEDFNATIGSR